MRALLAILAVIVLVSGCIGGTPADTDVSDTTQDDKGTDKSDFLLPEEIEEEPSAVDKELADCANNRNFLNFQGCVADAAVGVAPSDPERAFEICSSIIDTTLKDGCRTNTTFYVASYNTYFALKTCGEVDDNETRLLCRQNTLVAIADMDLDYALELADEYKLNNTFYYAAAPNVSNPLLSLDFCEMIDDNDTLTDDCYFVLGTGWAQAPTFDKSLTACMEIEDSSLKMNCTLGVTIQASVVYPTTAWTYCEVLDGASQRAECFATVAPTVALYDANLSKELCLDAKNSFYWQSICRFNIAQVIALSDFADSMSICGNITGATGDECFLKVAASVTAAGDPNSATKACNRIEDKDNRESCYDDFYN